MVLDIQLWVELEQVPKHFSISILRRVMTRSIPISIYSVQISLVLHQHLCRLQISSQTSYMKRSPLVDRAGFHIRPIIQQNLDNLCMTLAGCRIEWCSLFQVFVVDVMPHFGVLQNLDNGLEGAVLCCDQQVFVISSPSRLHFLDQFLLIHNFLIRKI